MVYAFDSLGYAKRLRDGGIPQAQAEVHAEAARDFIMAELVTKPDLLAIKADLLAVKNELKNDVLAVKQDLATVKAELQSSIAALDAKVDKLSLQLTVRVGAMVVVGLGALATILKLT